MSKLFETCESLKKLPDISKWKTNNVSDMSSLFEGCYSLERIPDISNWNTKNVSNINKLFAYCDSLTSVPDISKWNLCNLKKGELIFKGCKSLINIPDISKWTINFESFDKNLLLKDYQSSGNSEKKSSFLNTSSKKEEKYSYDSLKEDSLSLNEYYNIQEDFNSNDNTLNDHYDNFYNY